MQTLRLRCIALAALATGFPVVGLAAAKPSFDIAPPLKRLATVKLAEQLAHRPPPAAAPAEMVSPFNPPDFDKPDPSDQKPGANVADRGPANPGDPARSEGRPVAPTSDRAILEAAAARIPSLAAITRDGKPRLLLPGGKFAEIGHILTVAYDNQDYDLEIVGIDRTTFTLRYRGEEITRPIRLTK